jgi:hypothetical protein
VHKVREGTRRQNVNLDVIIVCFGFSEERHQPSQRPHNRQGNLRTERRKRFGKKKHSPRSKDSEDLARRILFPIKHHEKPGGNDGVNAFICEEKGASISDLKRAVGEVHEPRPCL